MISNKAYSGYILLATGDFHNFSKSFCLYLYTK
nr:MAG TPA: hypothetical protein [Caudoviricetes sp.]